jgi:hypothetical protein
LEPKRVAERPTFNAIGGDAARNEPGPTNRLRDNADPLSSTGTRGIPMKRLFSTGCLTAAVAAFLFLGTTSVQAQVVRVGGAAPKQTTGTGTANPNLYRANFSRPVRQPMPTAKGATNGMSNGMVPGTGQPVGFSGVNQGGFSGMNQGGYPGMYQGAYPGMSTNSFGF